MSFLKKHSALLLFITLVGCFSLLGSSFSYAQNSEKVKISGYVYDSSKSPVVGAGVLVEGTAEGVITDINGFFEMMVMPEKDITISFIGYENITMKASTLKGQKIFMEEDKTLLDDAVVVGYGTKKKETLTGAVSQVSQEGLATTTHSSLAQSLHGKVAGLQIRQNTGEPGDFNTTINVRGFGSPLYVIDGIPQDNGGIEFQKLNPKDIESISVIKDASAAVFGLRAANGVIIVTTNKGQKGRTKFSYDVVAGFQNPTDMPRMSSRSEWAQIRNDANINMGKAPMFTPDQLKYEMTAPSTDWNSLVMKKRSVQHQHNISASGGTDKVTYYFNFGYVNEDGILRSNDLNYNKYTYRANVNAKLTNNFSAEVSTSGRIDKKTSPQLGFYNILYGTRTSMPNARPYANDNPEYLATQAYLNPVALADSDISGYLEQKTRDFAAQLTLKYDVPFIQGLKLSATAAYTHDTLMDKLLRKSFDLYTYDEEADEPYKKVSTFGAPSTITNNWNAMDMLTIQAQVAYARKFADKHDVEATLVYEQHKFDQRFAALSREYDFYTNDQINQGSLNNQTNTGYEEERATMSVIGKFAYSYMSKYLIEFAFRTDGTYRYHPDKRWGFFPVISAGWRLSEEKFMKNIKWLSNFKIRGSYGIVGEDAGSPFQYVPGYSLNGGGGYEFADGKWTGGASSPTIVNPNLTWMTSHTADVGFDLGLFRNRLTIEFDWYQKDRHGLLATRHVSLPNTFGGSLPEENLNSDRVRGLDFTIGYNQRFGEFQFGVIGTFNYARRMNLYVEHGDYAHSMDKWRSGVDYRYTDFMWGYVVEGQFQNEEEILNAPIQCGPLGNRKVLPGDYKYKDVNEDGVIDGNDVVPILDGSTPKFHYGLTLTAEWKNFDLSMVFQGSAGYTIQFGGVYGTILGFDMNTPAYFYDRWHKADPYNPDSEWIPGHWPAARVPVDGGSIYNVSKIWRRDASYLRMKSLEFGYTLPKKWTDAVRMDGVRVYFNVHNVFTITDRYVKPFDPEKVEGLFNDGFTYPITRAFNFGVNINF